MQTSRTVSAPPSTTPMAFMEEWMRIVSVPVSPMAARSCWRVCFVYVIGCFQIHPNEKGVSSLECHTTGSCLPFLPASAKHLTKNQKAHNHSNQRTILSFLMPPAGLEPALCRQKGILSPSCLPAFGKVIFHSLYRLISHCERDFSFTSERDSHFLTR